MYGSVRAGLGGVQESTPRRRRWRVVAPLLAGHARQLTASQSSTTGQPVDYNSPGVFLNGRQVLFTTDRSGHNEIYVIDTNGKHQRQLTHTASTVNNWIAHISWTAGRSCSTAQLAATSRSTPSTRPAHAFGRSLTPLRRSATKIPPGNRHRKLGTNL